MTKDAFEEIETRRSTATLLVGWPCCAIGKLVQEANASFFNILRKIGITYWSGRCSRGDKSRLALISNRLNSRLY